MPRLGDREQHGKARQQGSGLSDEFLMYNYKVLPCGRKYPHDWASCPCGHKGERAARRDIRRHPYVAIACTYAKQKLPCPQGDACLFAHSLFEYWLHPARFRTEYCQFGSTCERPVCFFAHAPEELRLLDKSLPPAELCWSSGASINRLTQHQQGTAAGAAAALHQHQHQQAGTLSAVQQEHEQQIAALAALAGCGTSGSSSAAGAGSLASAIAAALTASLTGGGQGDAAASALQPQHSLDLPRGLTSMPSLPLLATAAAGCGHHAGLQSVQSMPVLAHHHGGGAGGDAWALLGGAGASAALHKSLSGSGAGSPYACLGSDSSGAGTPLAAGGQPPLSALDWKPWGSAGGGLFDAAPGRTAGSASSIASSGLNVEAPEFSPTGSPGGGLAGAGGLFSAHSEPPPLTAASHLLRSYAAANSAAQQQQQQQHAAASQQQEQQQQHLPDLSALLPTSLDVELTTDSGRLRGAGLAGKLAQLQAPAAGSAAGGRAAAGGGSQQQNVQQLSHMLSSLPEDVVSNLISLLQQSVQVNKG